MVIALQHAVAVAAGLAQHGQHPFKRHVQHHQGMGHQHQGGFQHLGYDLSGTGCRECIQVGVVPGAYQHADITVEIPTGVDDPFCQARVVEGHHQQAGAVNTRPFENVLAAGIAKQDMFAGGTGFL